MLDLVPRLHSTHDDRHQSERGGERSHQDRTQPLLAALKHQLEPEGHTLDGLEVAKVADQQDAVPGGDAKHSDEATPLVYYGDEIGMPGAGDPDNRRFMQWSTLDSKQTYLKDRLKKLGDIRSKHPALRRGTRTTLESSADVWAYSRITAGDTVYVAVNRSDSPKDVGSLPGGSYVELVTGAAATGPTVTIPARQTRIFVTK